MTRRIPVSEIRKFGADDGADLSDEDRKRAYRWSGLIASMGERFRLASFDSYRIQHDTQGEVVQALRDYEADLVGSLKSGRGVVLFGPSGTGKTHLVVALARAAVAAGARVRGLSGMTFFGAMRDAMDSDKSEDSIVQSYVDPHILLIDDLLPPLGPLTPWQSAQLYRIVDGRYRAAKCSWVTLNVDNGTEAEDRAGVAIIDRLRDGALAKHCAWPSFRRPRTVGQPKGDVAK